MNHPSPGKVCQVSYSNTQSDPRIVRATTALRRAGYSVSVCGGGAGIAANAMTPWRKLLIALRLAPVRLMPGLLSRAAYWSMADNRKLYRLIMREAPSVIHAHDWDTLPAAAKAARKLGAKLIYETHEYSVGRRRHRFFWRAFFPPYIRALEGRGVRAADAVIAVSDGLAAVLRNDYGLREVPTVVRSVTDALPRRPGIPLEGRLLVHYHGIFTHGRGLENLVRSVASWPANFRLRLTGWGQPPSFEARLRALVAKLGVEDRVEFAAKVPYASLIDHANDADIGICFWDDATIQRKIALPNKLFEYLAAGLMLVVGPGEELARVVRETGAGISLPDNRPDSLAGALAGLSVAEIAQFKKNAETAAREMSWRKEADRMLALFRRLAPLPEPEAKPAAAAAPDRPRRAASLLPRLSVQRSDTEPFLAFDYLAGFVRWIADSGHSVMTYDDLAFPIRHGHEQQELIAWTKRAQAEGRNGILIQYDVDARPELTMDLIDVHRDCRVPANVMVFNKRVVNDSAARSGHDVAIDPDYALDFGLLEAFQREGGIVGYHCNAFDRSGGNLERAVEIFHQDVAELRKHLDIRYFSMHGGGVSADGLQNSSIPIGGQLSDLNLTWVHNGHSVYFYQTWSDGGAAGEAYREESTDPLDFLFSSTVGTRSRLIFHPQYYGDVESRQFNFPVLKDFRWVKETGAAMQAGVPGRSHWVRRATETQASIDRFKKLFDAPAAEEPVFVQGVSRSGTTLLVSMFDAHPDGAMAYESYPSYLYRPDGPVIAKEDYIHVYQTLINCPENEAFNLLDRDPLKGLRLFAAVSSWTGMTVAETGELLRAWLVDHHEILSARDALNIIAASARFKVRASGATFWGTKCEGNFDDYFALWPGACLIYILRHGLDVLASQKANGAFNPDPETLGRNWRRQYENFRAYWTRNPEKRITLVRYEDLVSAPEATMREVCEALRFPYHPQMIRQHEEETTLTRNPRGQLSAKRVQEPIDTSSLERWRGTLSREEVAAFLHGAGEEIFLEHDFSWT